MQKKSFKIDSTIYSDECINASIEAFKEVTGISFQNGELFIEGESDSEIEEVFQEFMNYCLFLYIEKA